MKKFFSRFWKINWGIKILIWLVFCAIILAILLRKTNADGARKKEAGTEKETKPQEKKPCSHFSSDPERDKLLEKLYLVTGWDCDYCGKRVIDQGNKYLVNCLLKEDEHFSLIKNHLIECKEGKKVFSEIVNKKNNGLIYDNEISLGKKGYSKESINKIKSWGLLSKINLPNLKEEKRMGVVRGLSVIVELENNSSHPKIRSGKSADGVAFLVPRSHPITCKNLAELLTKKTSFFYSICGSKEVKTYEKIIAAFFIQRVIKKQKSWEYNLFFLETDKEGISSEFTSYEGSSAAVALYLALLSTYYQKPISKEVAATATINIGKISNFWCVQCFQENELMKKMEENFSQNKIGSIGGLTIKTKAAVETGTKKLILSTEQKEDYEKNVPEEIKKKLTVYYVKNVEELEKLFWAGEFS